MDRLRIAVVDTGVDPAHPAIPPVVGGARFSMSREGEVVTGEDYRDVAGHGTACAGLACRGIQSRVELLAARVIDDDGTSTVRLIEAAILWAVDRGARVVNASLGAPVWGEEARARLAAVCGAAREKGVVVIAAAGPEGTRALPAALEEVLSVGTASCPLDTIYVADEDGIDFLANGDLQRIPWLGGETVLGQGTSLAAAHVTNAVCRTILANPAIDVTGVRTALLARAVQGDAAARGAWQRRVTAFYRGRSPQRIAWLSRAAVYPFNKETHALVRFRRLLPFTLEAVVDPPGKRLSGRDAGEVIGEPSAGLAIQPSFERAIEGAGSVILGHTEAMTAGAPRAVLADLVRKAVERDKGVFSFSTLGGPELASVRALAEERGVPCVDPTITRAEVAPLFEREPRDEAAPPDAGLRHPAGARRRNLRIALRHDCPVLGVMGTSRSQGKLTLQLALRARLSKMGYRVAHFATEPTGMLFGASVTLPTGHERGHDLGAEEVALLTSILMTEIKNRERPDILIVGAQSSTVPLSVDHHRLGIGSLSALCFAASAAPDACVLVANPFDPPDHVERCRAAIESVLQSRVLAVAFGDQVWEEREWKGVARRRKVRLSEDDLTQRLTAWERRLGVPCCGVLSDPDQARLSEIVVEYFAAGGSPFTMGP